MSYTFGTLVDPAHYVEVPDPDNPGQVKRPDAGATLLVRDAETLASLPSITTLLYGYWAYIHPTVPQILVSGDGGSTWVGPLDAAEARSSAIHAGVDATTALQTANAAQQTATNAATTAQQALSAAQAAGSGGTFTGSVDWNTQVANKPSIPSNASDVGAIPTSAKGSPGGVATLGDGAGGTISGKVPLGQLPVGSDAQSVASGSHSHPIDVTKMPAGYTQTLFWDAPNSVTPQRGSQRNDITTIWLVATGSTPPPGGDPYMVDGHDLVARP